MLFPKNPCFQGGSDNPMPPLERQKLMNLKGTDQEKIQKYIFKQWRDLYDYHEHPDNPNKWGDCFLQRKFKTFYLTVASFFAKGVKLCVITWAF